MPYACLLFDLDGTLVDSRRDLAFALNQMLDRMGFSTVELDEVSRFVGDGARKLVERGLRTALGDSVTEDIVSEGLERFKEAYGACLLDTTTAYPGVAETLATFEGLPMGIVTNKPHGFSVTILEHLGLARFFKVVVGGDSTPERKPSPVPVLEALKACGVERPETALMIGDSANDILSGAAAGTRTCGVTYGFRDLDELNRAGANFIVGDFPGLLPIVGR
jgi:phosphoglycolate phosphatase